MPLNLASIFRHLEHIRVWNYNLLWNELKCSIYSNKLSYQVLWSCFPRRSRHVIAIDSRVISVFIMFVNIILCSLGPLVFLLLKIIKSCGFQLIFSYDRTREGLFQKLVVSTNLNIYMFITVTYIKCIKMSHTLNVLKCHIH